MVQYTRENLPNKSAVFVAFEKDSVRAAHPLDAEKILTIRPQTYIQYYPEIVVKSTGPGRNGNENVLRVEFDPQSAGLKEPIHANIDPDDPVVDILRNSEQNGTVISVGVETLRKKKQKGTNASVSPFTHIHALRGANNPNGSGATTDATGSNCRKIIALVNGKPGRELKSDPAEWMQLSTNRDGSLPPEGWKIVRNTENPDDWQTVATIVRDVENPAPATSQNAPAVTAANPSATDAQLKAAFGDLLFSVLTSDQTRAFLTATVNNVLDQRDNAGTEKGASFSSKTSEGTAYQDRTGDGQINLGSFTANALAPMHHTAFALLATDENPVPNDDLVWALTRRFATLTDHVQHDAYRGNTLKLKRISRSWSQAFRWIEFAMNHTTTPEITPETLAGNGSDDVQAWEKTLYAEAVHNLQMTGTLTGEHYTQQNAEKKAHQNTQRQNTAPANSPQQGQDAPAANGITNAIEALNNAWGSVDALRDAWKHAKEAGLLDATVAYRDNKVVPANSNNAQGTIQSFIERRVNSLNSETGNAAPETAPSGQEGKQTAGNKDAAATATLDADEKAMIESIMADLNAATDATGVRSAYERARATGTLSKLVPARFDGRTVTIDQSATAIPFSDIISEVREHLQNTAQQGQQEGSAPARSAQDLANDAETATELSVIESLRREADALGVLGASIVINGNSGSLRGWLDHRTGELSN